MIHKNSLLQNIKTIFFDYDGTIHNSLVIYAPAFRKAYEFLVHEGLADEKIWSDKEISYFLGFNPQDMWEVFMPHLTIDIKNKCSNIISNEMNTEISEGKPLLYDSALDTLRYLKEKGYILVFVSNCKNYYKESHTKLFQLDQYFDTLLCSEEYNFIPKHEIIKKVKNNYPPDYVIIGDRKQDMDAGFLNDIITIGCTYGYGLESEFEGVDKLINNISELKVLL